MDNINKLTTLIGSNGVGKANFLSIIEFIFSSFRDCIHQCNIEKKVSIYLGFEDKNTKETCIY